MVCGVVWYHQIEEQPVGAWCARKLENPKSIRTTVAENPCVVVYHFRVFGHPERSLREERD